MDHILRDLPLCTCYIDDIIVWSNSVEEHIQQLEEIFKGLQEVGLKVHPAKCVRVKLSEGWNGENNHYRKRELHEFHRASYK